jgi:hypothetical protein
MGQRAAASHAQYQPIQFVVSHQGTTTLPDGQQALVVLLPINSADLNVNLGNEQANGGTAVLLCGKPSDQAGVAGNS